MWNFLGKQILHIITVLVGISLLSFILANISAIDPAEAYAIRISKTVDEEIIEQYRDELGFNQSIPEQYLNWLKNAQYGWTSATHTLPADRPCGICYPLCL